MSVKLYEIDTVAIGRFNPHILSPPWLAKENVITQGGPVESHIAVAGRAIAFQFKTSEYTWKVDYNRLVVGTENPSGNTAAIVAKVVEKLRHTPVSAIGNNFRYRCNVSQWKGRLPKLDDVGFDKLKEYGDVQAVGWKASISQQDGFTVNTDVNLEPSESLSPMLTITFNYHRQVADAVALIAAAERFDEDRNASEKLLESLLHEKVES